jgi:hypothetical protein
MNPNGEVAQASLYRPYFVIDEDVCVLTIPSLVLQKVDFMLVPHCPPPHQTPRIRETPGALCGVDVDSSPETNTPAADG